MERRPQTAPHLHQLGAGLARQYPRRLLGPRSQDQEAPEAGRAGRGTLVAHVRQVLAATGAGWPTSASTTSTWSRSTTAAITPLTTDGSRTIINGTFDWVYEEELSMRDGFRWSPDGRSHRLLAARRIGRPRLPADQQHRLALLLHHPGPVPQGGHHQLLGPRRRGEQRRAGPPPGSTSRAIRATTTWPGWTGPPTPPS